MALFYSITIATFFTSVLCLEETESNTITDTIQEGVANKLKMLQDLADTDLLHDCYLVYFNAMNSEEEEEELQENSYENPTQEDTNLLGAGSSKFLKCIHDAYQQHFTRMEDRRKKSGLLLGNNVFSLQKPSLGYENVLPPQTTNLGYADVLSIISPTKNTLLDYVLKKPNIQVTYPGYLLAFGRKQQDRGL